MEFTEELEEADSELTPFGVLFVVLQDDKLAVECMDALEQYARDLRIGNNQAPAIIFFVDGPEFGAIDLWSGDEAVQ
ncbi:MAG: hypothetical protein KAS32_14780 [Candidatus Peribacteraceae bacterium]|nr:hypothetical protein [Candidatus Peribacteraceae bacterium]